MTEAPQTPLQRQIVQLAQGLATRLEQTVQQVPMDSLLDACEALLLDHGRQFLRDSLAATLQLQITETEKKGALPVPVLADTPAGTRVSALANSSPLSAPSI